MKRTTTHQFTVLSVLFAGLLLFGACSKEEGPVLPDANPPATSGASIKIIEDELAGVPIVVVGSRGQNFATAFHRTFNGQLRSFTPLQGQLPSVMEDDLGNRWDVFGRAVSGPDQGSHLEYINSGIGFWFVFGGMYPGLEIHGQGKLEVSVSQDTLEGWSIPTSAVAQGSGFDAIAALENPKFSNFNQLELEPDDEFLLEEEDLVVAVSLNGETKVYPHAILDWHEVINDVVGGVSVTVTYCPLTGTAKVWERESSTTFGVSGLLYNSNVIPFDRSTESYWNQLEARSVFGNRQGEQLKVIPHLETHWDSWLSFESSPLLLSTDTGIDRNYTRYPYGDYRTSNLIAYPLTFSDDRLPPKERVFSVLIAGQAKVYPLSDF